MGRDRSRSPRERGNGRRHSRSPAGRRDHRRSRSPLDRDRRNRKEVDQRRRSRSPLERDYRHSPERRRSPDREQRRRSRSPDRKGDRHRRDSPDRYRKLDESESSSKKRNGGSNSQKIDLDSLGAVDEEMQKMMGFGGFNTSKNKKVQGNCDGVAQINKPRRYRQYMNRKGGFNRPLDYVA
ncbi:hypothetical protein L596_007362 [Steinernema carpocapsae]|uniref:U4/U6.U5 small nuclear ribonucleoprotein 27 kDa protein n=1 Tax=Steinernema carpocapsae TaxID=34508 RepID=A0A4U5P922_STECR|nr:hypothetical protein L596_007362 [Steinernema carpocapsae]